VLAEVEPHDVPPLALGEPVISAKIPTAAMKAVAHEDRALGCAPGRRSKQRAGDPRVRDAVGINAESFGAFRWIEQRR